jgi:hypothetical protein
MGTGSADESAEAQRGLIPESSWGGSGRQDEQ